MTDPKAPTPRTPRRRLRNYLLDPRFQLKYTGVLVGTALLLLSSLGLVIKDTADLAVQQAHEAADLATVAEDHAERAFRESQTSARVMRMSQLAQAGSNPDLVRAIETELAHVDASARASLAHVQAQRVSVRRQRARIEALQRRTFDLIVGSGVLFLVTLAFLGIVITHRIVGPVYKFKRLFRSLGSGRLHVDERLRRGDELTDLYDSFTAMVTGLREAQSRELAALDGVLKRAEATGADADVIDRLKALRSKMEQALDAP